MSQPNPYESPADASAAAHIIPAGARIAPPALTGRGVWRCGDLLVVHRSAKFPYRCVLTGEPAVEWLEQDFSLRLRTPSPLWFLLGWTGYVIGLATTEETVTIQLPLSQGCVTLRSWVTSSAWLMAGMGFIGVFFCCALPVSWFPADALGGLAMLIAAPLVGMLGTRTLGLVYGDVSYLWLSGAHPGYLADLDEWPYRMPSL